MLYTREVINGAALIICPKCRGVCPGKFECDKIKQFINENYSSNDERRKVK